MRKFTLIFLTFVSLLLVAGWWFISNSQPPHTTLEDGSKVSLPLIQSGLYEDLSKPAPASLDQLLAYLPGPIRAWFGPPKNMGNSTGRSYYTYAYQEDSLHLWLSWFRGGQPINPSDFRKTVYLCDDQGWIYESYGWAEQGSGRFTQSELSCSSFSALPRWNKSMRVLLLIKKVEGHLGEITFDNPLYRDRPLTNWPVHPIPQETTVNGTVFRLTSLTPDSPPYWARKLTNQNFRVPPHWKITFDSIDPDGNSNTWHEIRTSYYDNYGNHSLHGLPSRLDEDNNLNNLQWKVELVTAADQKSRSASNFFLTLPAMKLPGPGQVMPLTDTNVVYDSLNLHFNALAGSGIITYTNKRLDRMQAADYEINGESWSTSTRQIGTNQVATIEQTKKSTHITFSPEGSYTNFHFTCQAIDESTGSKVWLMESNKARKEPHFYRKYDEDKLMTFSCESLDPDRTYTFIFGAHRTRNVTFFIRAPVHDPLK